MAVERKYERDIDVLLAEEFSVSAGFANWFLSQTQFKGRSGKITDVFVSKSNSMGESDLIVTYALDDGARIALWIEDKVDAGFQPRQAERYRQRAEKERSKGSFDEFETILCAPSGYAKAHPEASEFDRFVDYEMIGNAISEHDKSARGEYRAAFIATAAMRRLNAWTREQDDATDLFWNIVYGICQTEFPILERKPITVTKGSPWINFRPRDMPGEWAYIAMKGKHGCMDLTLTGCRMADMLSEVQPLLVKDMTLHQTSKSTSIRLSFPSFNVEDGIEVALPNIRKALEAAVKLVEFYRAHREKLLNARNRALIDD